ncbi:MAG: alpha/beta fold hydrolase [Steroidobacteraceae bacterium]
MTRRRLDNIAGSVACTQFTDSFPRLAYDLAGTGEEHVVLLHGVGGNRRNWAPQVPVIGRHFRVVALDARGYGESDDYSGELSISVYSDDVVRLLDHLGVDAAHFVGLSMGGNVAMQCALDHRARVRSLVLCDTDRGMQHLSEEDRREFLRLRRDPLLAGRSLHEIAPDLVDSLVGPHASSEARAELHDSLLRLHADMYVKSVEATVNFDITDSVHRISCPTLVVVGEMDRLTPVCESKAICNEIRGAELAVIPLAGHISNIEQAEVFNREVLGFLLRVSGITATAR